MRSDIRNTIVLLRLPFSVFLLPITLFSLYFIQPQLTVELILVLFIWHFLVFPSSNAYNSFNDRDTGPIGALETPPSPSKLLLHTANAMDAMAIILSIFVNYYFTALVLLFIVVSRLYSYRNIRLKKYPVLAFIIVCICQGSGVFCANVLGLASVDLLLQPPVMYAAIACFLFIGTLYPITQIYQHEADSQDGVKTISYVLGKKGTFIFSGLFFFLATFFIYLSFQGYQRIGNFWLFNLIMLPVTIYFITWAIRSFKNTAQVNFKNTMLMLVLSATFNNIFFLILLIK